MKLNSMENFGPLLIIDDSRRERKEEKWVWKSEKKKEMECAFAREMLTRDTREER